MRRRHPNGQCGGASVEAALMLPVILGATLIGSDLYLVSQARADLERGTATLSTILANQNSLTTNGFDQLVDGILAGTSGRYQLHVGQVWRSGEVAWTLSSGNAEDICDNPLKTSPYRGPLPERDEDDETDSVAMLVVQACQETSALHLSSLVLDQPILKSISIDRMRTTDIELDDDLRNRAGLSDEEDEDEE